MELLTYKEGQTIFRQGETGDCMYRIVSGSVEIWLNYKEPRARLLATLGSNTFFGEMALLDECTRSATAVASSDFVSLKAYPKNALNDMLASDGADFRSLLSQMTSNLVHLTDNYRDVCRTIADYHSAKEAGKEPDSAVQKNIKRYADMDDGTPFDGTYWADADSYMNIVLEHEADFYNHTGSWMYYDIHF